CYDSSLDKEYFNKFTDVYSPYHSSDLVTIIKKITELIENGSSCWACEVGSADGQFSRTLEAEVPGKLNLVGLDIADKILKKYPFNKICGSAFQLPLANQSLGLILFPASFHHLSPFPEMLAEVERVLAPGGLVYFLEPNYFHPHRRFFMTHKKIYQLYRQANDVPVNPEILKSQLSNIRIRTIYFRYLNIRFRKPGPLQKIQNILARIPWPQKIHRFIMPWFILIGRKEDTPK
ncbi:MAG: class I SAM-dependent methyltransferase, partial [Desulfobulbaceae bacterium]|nr:class I SAM-dependent methyltransferase [Desulfobulbaceae bacterium]